MIAELHIQLLGGLRITRDGTPVTSFVSSKAPALLSYLAVTGRPHFRTALAGLLWSELPEEDARGSLRGVLTNLRQTLAPYLIVTRGTVALDRSSPYRLDVEQFEAALQDASARDIGRLREVVALYKGDFLEGFYVRDAPLFDSWAMAQRERLRQRMVHALHELVDYYTERQEYAASIDFCTRLLQLDPWREEAHRQLMLLLAQSGQPSAALHQYEQCRRIFADELGAEPDEATTVLAEQIRAGAITARQSIPPARQNLPFPPTPLLGREQELMQLGRLLQRPTCRLLTLVGPGGVGKTRLALEIAAMYLEDFADGAFVVELAPLRDPALLSSSIAQTLGVRETGDQPVIERVKAWLRTRRLLLLLDNFEHLGAAAPVVNDLLAACPQLKVLVTSRAPLRLRGEQAFLVPSLAVPDPAHLSVSRLDLTANHSQYAAVELFVQRATSVKPDFQLTDENVAAVVEICRRLDGLPLAIELATARISFFSPHALLARLGSRLILLTGGAKDLPVRQQTLRDTISWSYDLLEPAEQACFRRLGVFADGFTLEAAQAVCRADDAEKQLDQGSPIDILNNVEALVEKSLLRHMMLSHQGGGRTANAEPRFLMAETIREFALERLKEAGEAEAMRRRHAQFFLALAEQAEPELEGPRQLVWLESLQADLDNLRAALAWSEEESPAEHRLIFALRFAGALGEFWQHLGHLSEGRLRLQQVLAATGAGKLPSDLQQAEEVKRYRAKALMAAASLARAQSDYQEATALLEASLTLYRELGEPDRIAHALNILGSLATDQGNYGSAARLAEEALALFRELEDHLGIAQALHHLGDLAREQGDYERATLLLEETLTRYREAGDSLGPAWALNGLGDLALCQGEIARAIELYRACRDILEATGETQGLAIVLCNLAWATFQTGDLRRAATLFTESSLIAHQVGDAGVIARTLAGLGAVARAEGQIERGAACYRDSLTLYRKLGATPRIVMCLEGLAGIAATACERAAGEPMMEAHGDRGLSTAWGQYAARLFAAAQALRDTLGMPVPLGERASYDRDREAASALLDAPGWAAAWAEGRAMTLAQVTAYALEAVPRIHA